MEPEDLIEEASERVLLLPSKKKRVPLPCIEVAKFRRFAIPMVEVFSVCFLKFHGPGSHLYGTLSITNGDNSQYLYNRKKEESEFICPGDNVLLTGPAHPVLGYDDIYIDVDLLDRDDPIPRGHVFGRDLMPWDHYPDRLGWSSFIPYPVYNEPVYEEVECKYCNVGVSYIVFRDAVYASVNVTLIVRDWKRTVNLFGSITAGNCNYSDQSVLFQKALDDHIDVMPGQLIPLSRSTVTVPVTSVLIIRANLCDYGAISSGVIAKGTAKFPSKFSGTFEERICGQCSEIRVKVTWTSIYF